MELAEAANLDMEYFGPPAFGNLEGIPLVELEDCQEAGEGQALFA